MSKSGRDVWRRRCEAVVLGGDGNLARAEVFDRVVSAAVAKLEFVGGATEAVGQDLMSKTYSEDRGLAR